MNTTDNLPEAFNLLIGSYTTDQSEGISVCRFEAESGRPFYLNGIEGIDDPSYLCISEGGHFIYAVNEIGDDNHGKVSALRFEPDTGTLKLINEQLTDMQPCYISV